MKYIASFDIPEYTEERRSINLAGVNVMDYMVEVFREVEPVEIISPTRSVAKTGMFPARTISIKDNVSLRLPKTKGVKSKFGRIRSLIAVQLWLLKVLLFDTKRGENIIVYHSAALMPIIKLGKKIKGFNLILEVREIYSDIQTHINKKRELEYFKLADKFIFATELLNKKLNYNHRPYIVAPGIYHSSIDQTITKWNDGKIHLVYGGNFRRAKGGAIGAIQLAEYLPINYVIHILGSGDQKSMEDVNNLINNQNKKNGAKVIYEGVLRGKAFTEFLQRCDIGLSTQNSEGEFNNSSFPSKILTYLSAGLEVISSNIPAVSTSPIGKFVHYYENQTPEMIANRIISITNKLNSTEILSHLNSKLTKDFKEFYRL